MRSLCLLPFACCIFVVTLAVQPIAKVGGVARGLNHFLTVPVAHKTGDFPPVLANDVGVIYARSGPIVVSFLGNAITGNYGEAEDRIGRFAQQFVEYLDK